MKRKPPTLDRVFIETRTEASKARVRETLDLAKRLRTDPDRKKRVERAVCKNCYYLPMFAAAGTVETQCANCSKPQLFTSLSVDVLCEGCAAKLGLCKHCGGKWF